MIKILDDKNTLKKEENISSEEKKELIVKDERTLSQKQLDNLKIFKPNVKKLVGTKVVGKIELPIRIDRKKKSKTSDKNRKNNNSQRKRKRIVYNKNKPININRERKEAGKRDKTKDEQKKDNRRNFNKVKDTKTKDTKTKNTRVVNDTKTKDQKKTNLPQTHNKKPQSRISLRGGSNIRPQNQRNVAKRWQNKKFLPKPEIVQEDVNKQIRETLAKLTTGKKTKTSKYKTSKREFARKKREKEIEKREKEKRILKVTEFISVNEFASMMSIGIDKIIASCMNLGLFVSINQRLDSDTLTLIAEEFGYKVELVSLELQENLGLKKDKEEDLIARAPIVTVMGHVDHGKTSLLDYVRNTNVIAGEAGGITQHIGAYNVTMDDGRKITFLDTPGHKAFTAMRARGAKVTDVVIIVVSADDGVMPRTVEAINHAKAAGVPIVFAINKIDKPGANPEKIKEELAKMDMLVEDWGGKYQSQEISAKFGKNIDELLEKVIFEADLLNLKSNPKRLGYGSVLESSLDKGRGYVTTLLVENGNINIGDVILAGPYTGRIKAMYNERNQKVKKAGPSTPVLVLGLNGAPSAGDNFNIMKVEREAKEIANKREQLQREQNRRTQKHITLDEIGRRIAIGDFKELNLIVKGDVDGSIEALADSLIKKSTEKIQVNVIHKAVGQISESDVMLATASNAIIIGFQVRISQGARKIAEKENIDYRLYSIIYDAVKDLEDAMLGMLKVEHKEVVIATLEIRETFKISKVGTIAGCLVKDGKIARNSEIRLIRDGIVVYTGSLGSLKRFKDDVKEVQKGYECGLNIENFNDVKNGDIVEAFEKVEIKNTSL
ncbi:MAG: translation initiation factor IF-2 [Bacteroidetes bacterium 4572_128]|nr:MAG: translation initiation factor IF-2 [Bacteroidetes bacterium 4572_128]